MQENNLIALIEEISNVVGVQEKAGVSLTCPTAGGDFGLSQTTYCTNLFIDLSLPPSPQSCHMGLFVCQHIKLILTLGLCTTFFLHLEHVLLLWSQVLLSKGHSR